ncbi:MAG TPA: DUF4062 domain-containing protein, partial [Blastocatellia bacterium]
MAEEKKTAMISSTSVDLPEHRKEAIDACLRQGFFPIAMEHLPARDADAIRVSLEMVDKADVYIGIYAWRYGHVPEGRDFALADERLHHALTRSRQVNLLEEKLPALIALAELRCQQGKPDEAREYLNDVWDSAERGPYPLFHADAFNVLAQIE